MQSIAIHLSNNTKKEQKNRRWSKVLAKGIVLPRKEYRPLVCRVYADGSEQSNEQ